jgi:geranylgeranyl reductase family protein
MIGIIGGGPVGSYAAYLLAKKEKVKVFEEHSSVGLPVQCTGLTTEALNSIIKVRKSFLVNEISRVKIFSPNGNFINVKLKNKNFVIDRMKFDRNLARMAKDRGVDFFLNHKFVGFTKSKSGLKLKFKGRKDFVVERLIGADGPMSVVAKSAGIFGKRRFIIGLQARVSSNFEKDLINFYLDKRGFRWIVPESEKVARVGIASYDNPNLYFKDFLKRLNKYKVREYHSGIIPLYSPNIISQKGNVYLVGDAATQVKATTFGGLVPGLICAEELSKAILENKSYQKLWKKRIGKDLLLGLFLRKKLDRFSNENYNKLISLFKKKSLRKIIESNDRDFPSKFLFKLLIKEPRLLRFV